MENLKRNILELQNSLNDALKEKIVSSVTVDDERKILNLSVSDKSKEDTVDYAICLEPSTADDINYISLRPFTFNEFTELLGKKIVKVEVDESNSISKDDKKVSSICLRFVTEHRKYRANFCIIARDSNHELRFVKESLLKVKNER